MRTIIDLRRWTEWLHAMRIIKHLLKFAVNKGSTRDIDFVVPQFTVMETSFRIAEENSGGGGGGRGGRGEGRGGRGEGGE